MSKKWAHATQSVGENRKSKVEFLHSKECYFDFLSGPYVASNSYVVETLTHHSSLVTHGTSMGICLAKTGPLMDFAAACSAGSSTILCIYDERAARKGTVEIDVQLDGGRNDTPRVQFNIVQHTGYKNGAPSCNSQSALTEVLNHLEKPSIQQRAVEGIRASKLRLRTKDGETPQRLILALLGQEVFDQTFAELGTTMMARFTGLA